MADAPAGSGAPDLDAYLSIRAARQPTFLAGGSDCAFLSDRSGLAQVWVQGPSGGDAPRQLTVGGDRVQFLRASPTDPDAVVFGRDHGGDERTGLHLLSVEAATERPLAAEPEVLHWPGAFTPDGATFLCTATARNGVDFDLHAVPLTSGGRRLVATLEGWNTVADVSRDGAAALVAHARSSMDGDCLRVDLASGAVDAVASAAEPRRHLPVGFSDDGRVLLRSDRGGDMLRVGVERPDGGWRWLGPHRHDADAAAHAAGTLALACNADGTSRLLLVDVERDTAREVALPLGVVANLAVSACGRTVAFELSGPRHNPDVWLADVATGEAARLTRSPTAGVDLDAFVEPVRDTVPSFDGVEVPVWTYRPPHVARPPVVVWVHGGPESQARPAFDALIQYLVATGVAVVVPNVRGSTGYGRSYAALDDRRRRPDAVADLLEVGRWVQARPDLDGERMAVAGGSYGGFMVLSAITAAPELWAAAVDIVGIANLVTFLERTGSYRRAVREVEYGSLAEDRDFLERISPVHRADRIATPLLVIHGANDPRVPLSEAEQIVASVRARGRPVELLVFDDEGHGIAKDGNRRLAYRRMCDFLAEHLAR